MSSIKNFFHPKADFFGPQADELVDLLVDKPIEHLIAGCDAMRVQAINTLAQKRIHCEVWPEWQRYDGTIVYEKLPEDVKKIFKPDYLDKDGYVEVGDLHIFGKNFLLGLAESCKGRGYMECPFDRNRICQLVACPALSIRLAEGREFDPSQHKGILLQDAPVLHLDRKGQRVPLHRRLKEMIQKDVQDEEMDRFKRVWEYALKCSKTPATSNALPAIISLMVGGGCLTLLLKSSSISRILYEGAKEVF